MMFWRSSKICSRILTVLWKKSFKHASKYGKTAGINALTPKWNTFKKTYCKFSHLNESWLLSTTLCISSISFKHSRYYSASLLPTFYSCSAKWQRKVIRRYYSTGFLQKHMDEHNDFIRSRQMNTGVKVTACPQL